MTRIKEHLKTNYIQEKRKDLELWVRPSEGDYYLLFLQFAKKQHELFRVADLIKKKLNYMKKQIKLPKFKSEDQERAYWSKMDLSDYFDPSDVEKVSLPNLKPTTRAISLRIPEFLIDRVKEKANEIAVPYQSLIKGYIKEGLFGAAEPLPA